MAFAEQMRMLFINLISNALKFHSKDRDPKIRIKASIEGLNWIFSVQDNGIGIADHNREKVFKIFQRLHKTSEYQGAGIGLAHCKKIVDLHSGHIWVESEKEKAVPFSLASLLLSRISKPKIFITQSTAHKLTAL